MQINQLDLKSIRGFGIHGAIGLLMGTGLGFIMGIFLMGIFGNMISSLTADFTPIMNGAMLLFTIVGIYTIYGFYIRYIFGGEKRSSRTSITFAAAGIIGGVLTAVLLAWDYIFVNGNCGWIMVPLFITLVFTGPVLGFPKLRNMVIMTASSAFGAAASYGIYTLGQNISNYLNNSGGGALALFISVLFTILAIGIAGASIAIGMYFTERTAFQTREIPRFLKITRGAGIVITLIVLFILTLLFLSVAKYATTEVSINISPDGGNTTVLLPILLEDGNVMEMYGKPAISGKALTEIIYTDHGKVIKITGSGSLTINMKQTGGIMVTDPEADKKFINGFTLSTANATNYGDIRGQVDVWVYSEEDGTMLSLSISRDNGWGRNMRISTEQEVKLIRGWQAVKLSVGSLMYD